MIENKKDMLALWLPLAVLRAETPEAERAVPDGLIEAGLVGIRKFPFRVGRESRGTMIDGRFHRVERPRQANSKPNNDLYLIDAGQLLQVSREHFLIEQDGDGFVLVDRGSTCGTTVGQTRVGGGCPLNSAPVRDGDRIGVGTDATPYRFTFIVLADSGKP